MLRVPSNIGPPSTITIVFLSPWASGDLTLATGVTAIMKRQNGTSLTLGFAIVSATPSELVAQYAFVGGEIVGTGAYSLAPTLTVPGGSLPAESVTMFVSSPWATPPKLTAESWVATTTAIAPQPIGPGPSSRSVADIPTLEALSTTGLLFGSQASVVSIKRTYYLDPTSIAIPDGTTNPMVVPAVGGGNWLGQPGVGVLGRSVSGTSIYWEWPEPGDPIDWMTIAAGQTAVIYTSPVAMGFGAQAKIAADVQVQTAAPLLAVLGCTGLGVSPIVLTFASTATLTSGGIGAVAGVLGNTAANTVPGGGTNQTVTVLNGTQVALNGTTGNGAYAGGGAFTPLDFGDWTWAGTYRNCVGATVNSQGGSAGQDLTTPAESLNATGSVAATAVGLGTVGGQPCVIVTAPPNTAVRAVSAGSGRIHPVPGAGPAPTQAVLSVSSGTAQGGTPGVATGLHYTGATQVYIIDPATSTIYPCSFSIVNDGTINFTTGPGPQQDLGITGNFVIVTGNGVATTPGGFTYFPDPISIAGNNPTILRFWGDQSSIQHTTPGNVVTGWNDKSGNGQNVGVVGAPVYEPNSTNFTPNGPAILLDGATSALQLATFTLGSGSAVPLFVWVCARVTTSAVGFHFVANLFSARLGTNDQLWSYGGGAGAVAATLQINFPDVSIANAMVALTVFGDGVNGTSQINGSAGNKTLVTGSHAGAGRDGALQILSFGCDHTGTSNFCPMEIVAAVVMNVQPTTKQRAALEAYGQRICGVL